jgi:hypothetical protein
MTRKCAENTLAYHLENRFNKGGIDIDVRADMLKDIAGLSLRDQLKRIEGAKSEFERLLSQDEINLLFFLINSFKSFEYSSKPPNGFLRLSAVVLAPSVVETIPPSRQL